MTDIQYFLSRSDIFKLLCGEELMFNSEKDFLKSTFKISEEDKTTIINIFNKSKVSK